MVGIPAESLRAAAAAAAGSAASSRGRRRPPPRATEQFDRDFGRADAIRDELSALHGVSVFDPARTWTYNKYRCTDEAAAAEGGVDVVAVEKLLAERLQAKVQTRRDETKRNEMKRTFKRKLLFFRAPHTCRDPS